MSGRLTFAVATILAAALGVAASIHAYLTPETGVDATAGPILTGLGLLGMAAVGVLVLALTTGRPALMALFLLAGLGTCFAALLLQQPLILVPAIVAYVALPVGQVIGDPS